MTYLISYSFDCIDGHIARKYKMFSKYGDIYDHVSDAFKFALIFITLIYIDFCLIFLYYKFDKVKKYGK